MPAPLNAEQETRAQELLALLRRVVEDDLLALARLLAGTDEAHTFGPTEFQARDLLLQAGAKAYQAFLAQKKTATEAPASSARAAVNRPPSTGTGSRNW
jgi:parvulin-like peptidyl-prolyl isomerase